MESRRLRIGLALGAGASHGWAHIGVIRELAAAGIVPDIVCGTSAGALVGAHYAAGRLDKLERWVLGLTVGRTLDFLRLKRGHSLFSERLLRELGENFRGQRIEDLNVPFAAVATELVGGREFRIRTGSIARAVAASGAYPLLFPPVRVENRWLIDGCLVNPVPVSACRALGADVVIGVSLRKTDERRAVALARTEQENWRVLFTDQHRKEAVEDAKTADRTPFGRAVGTTAALVDRLSQGQRAVAGRERRAPGMLSMLARSVVAFNRLRGPGTANARADVLLTPRLGRLALGPEEAQRAITAGRAAVVSRAEALAGIVSAQSASRLPDHATASSFDGRYESESRTAFGAITASTGPTAKRAIA